MPFGNVNIPLFSCHITRAQAWRYCLSYPRRFWQDLGHSIYQEMLRNQKCLGCTQLTVFECDEYRSTVAETVDGAKKLFEDDFNISSKRDAVMRSARGNRWNELLFS